MDKNQTKRTVKELMKVASPINNQWVKILRHCKLSQERMSGWPSGLRRQTQGDDIPSH